MAGVFEHFFSMPELKIVSYIIIHLHNSILNDYDNDLISFGCVILKLINRKFQGQERIF